MKKVRNNKVIIVLLIILFICLVVLGIGFYEFFYKGASTSKYGDRLKDIDSYPLSETLEEDIEKIYSDIENIDNIKVNNIGKIVYININLVKKIDTNEAKELASKSLEAIGEENLTYYDVQYIITCTEEEESDEVSSTEVKKDYPMFGSKSSNSDKIVW